MKKQGLASGQGLAPVINEFALRAGNDFALRMGHTGGSTEHLMIHGHHSPHRLMSSQDEAEDEMKGTYANVAVHGQGLPHQRTATAAAAAAVAAVAMRDEGAILRRAERARERALRGPRTKGMIV